MKLGVARAAGGAPPVWLDLQAAGLGEDVYLARVAWRDDRTVVATVQSRDQRTCRVQGSERVRQLQTAPSSVGFHSFRLIFRRGIISRSNLDRERHSLERARAEQPS